MMERPVITEEEKQVDYSDLFYKPLEPVADELLRIMEKSPVNPAHATSVFDRNDILRPGYLAVENGG